MAGPRLDSQFTAQRYQAAAYPQWLHETTETPACRGVDPELFFPANKHEQADRARAYCFRCPLRITCRDWALAQPIADLHGIWGGLSRAQRDKLRRRMATAQRTQEAA